MLSVHPAFALTRTRLTETRSEFDVFLQANQERLIPLEGDQNASAAWIRAVSRASGIEGVYSGMEGVLKEVHNVVDGAESVPRRMRCMTWQGKRLGAESRRRVMLRQLRPGGLEGECANPSLLRYRR